MKTSGVSAITKSLAIEFTAIVNSPLLADLGYINLFYGKLIKIFAT